MTTLHIYTVQGTTLATASADDARDLLVETYGEAARTLTLTACDDGATMSRVTLTSPPTRDTVTHAAIAARGRGFPFGTGPLWVDGHSLWSKKTP